MNLSAFIAYRYSRSSPNRSFIAFINLFSIIGIALGLAALILVLSVMNGLEGQLKKRVLGIVPHIVANSSESIEIPNHINEKVLQQVPYAEREVIVQSRNHITGVFLQGIDIQKDDQHSIVLKNVLMGDWKNLQAGSFNIGISQILANKLGVDLGDKIRLISTSASINTLLGRLPSQRLANVAMIYSVNSELDESTMLIHLNDLARLSRQKTQSVVQQRFYLTDAFEYHAINQYLNDAGYQTNTWRDRQGPLFDAVKMEKNMMALMLLLIIAVAAFNVVSALVMVVSEKKTDIAILQTQGMLPQQVMWIFLYNGVFNGLKGLLAGVFFGLIACFFINDILRLLGSNLAFGEDGIGLPIIIQANQIILICVSTLLLCILASYYPAKKAQSYNPISSLRYE